MPGLEESNRNNIYVLLEQTQRPEHLAELVGSRREVRGGGKIDNLIHLFVQAGTEGMLALKEKYFRDVDLHPVFFVLSDAFNQMPEEDQSAFLDNYAAVIIGISLIALKESYLSQGQTFLRESFTELHTQACNHVFMPLEVKHLPVSERINLLGNEEILSDEQWQTLVQHHIYDSDILDLQSQHGAKMPQTIKSFLQTNQEIYKHIAKIYAVFTKRKEELADRIKVPEEFRNAFRQGVGSSWQKETEQGWDPLGGKPL